MTTTARTFFTTGALLLCLLGTAAAMAQTKPKAAGKKAAAEAAEAPANPEGGASSGGEKAVSGMSIVGNSETPKSLTIIPWKSSEIGKDTDFKSTLLSQDIVPIDKPSFLRELDFYKLSNTK